MDSLQTVPSSLSSSSALRISPSAVEIDVVLPNKTRVYPNPLPMQYLGSKARITNWILDSINEEFSQCDTFFDLFAGTGSVSLEAAIRDYSILANDIQPYSYGILKSLFSLPKKQLQGLVPRLKDLKTKDKILGKGRSYLKKHLEQEDEFLKRLSTKSFKWKSYRKFCDETPIIDNNNDLKKISSGSSWCLFCRYYANNYFGVRQTLEIDALRQFADTLPSAQKENLIAAVISVLTFAVSSTTHLAQYLKPNSDRQARFLLKKRSISIVDGVIERIVNLQTVQDYTDGKIYNLDFMKALQKAPSGSNTVVYADPPYFKEHYSRYYHVLDTFYLYDYPELTMNDRTKNITAGRYRDNRIRSDFGLKSKVADAFEAMLNECYKKRFHVAISYADTSLIGADQMLEIIEASGFKATVKQKGLLHSAQGQPGNKIAQEFLYLLTRQDDA